MCVEQGSPLGLPLTPFRHCKSVKITRHPYQTYQCKLHDMSNMLSFSHSMSVEYVLMGGHIEEMGYLNIDLRRQGNDNRSLRIKVAYTRCVAENRGPSDFEGIGRCLFLPGFVVKKISSYI